MVKDNGEQCQPYVEHDMYSVIMNLDFQAILLFFSLFLIINYNVCLVMVYIFQLLYLVQRHQRSMEHRWTYLFATIHQTAQKIPLSTAIMTKIFLDFAKNAVLYYEVVWHKISFVTTEKNLVMKHVDVRKILCTY